MKPMHEESAIGITIAMKYTNLLRAMREMLGQW